MEDASTTQYLSIMNGNPFNDDPHVQWHPHDVPGLPKMNGESSAEGLADVRRYKQRNLAHSQSASNVGIVAKSNHINTSHVALAHKQSMSLSQLGGEIQSPVRSPRRGRQLDQTPSPTRNMEDVDEEEMLFYLSPAKRSRSPMKKMFGENGWLGKSTSMKELQAEQKKSPLKHWGGKLKQRVGDLTEDVTKMLPNPFNSEQSPGKRVAMSKFPISLDPPTQAKLYSEIELMICATANQYLMTQRREGRISIESIAKITNFWASKGRPQVIEFQFDQATQRDLILYNLKTFRFYGERAENAVSLNSMMYNWKTLAKEMAVRTFCTPDSVIRKHLHDIYQILEMLGAPLVTFLAFQEIQVKALKVMRDEQLHRDQVELVHFGVERAWNPPESVLTTSTDDDGNLVRYGLEGYSPTRAL